MVPSACAVHIDLLALNDDVLLAVCARLDPCSLAALACTCVKLRNVSEHPAAWERLCDERWFNPQSSAFPAVTTSAGASGTVTSQGTGGRRVHGDPDDCDGVGRTIAVAAGAGVAWKALFAQGNGWDPPHLRHATLRPAGDYISAMQPYRLPARVGHGGAGGGGDTRGPVRAGPGGVGSVGGGSGDLLLALADSEELQVWRVPTDAAAVEAAEVAEAAAEAADLAGREQGGACGSEARATDGAREGSAAALSGVRWSGGEGTSGGDAGSSVDRGGGGSGSTKSLERAAAYPLARPALIYSLAWVDTSGGGGAEGGGAGSSSGSSGSMLRLPPTSPPPADGLILAAGTYQGTVEWYKYEAGNHVSCGGCSSRAGGGGSRRDGGRSMGPGSSSSSGGLRLLHTTSCGSAQPLVDLHVLPGSSGGGGGNLLNGASGGGLIGGGGGSRGLLAALQDASFALAGAGGARNAVQLFDCGSMQHLAAVVDPFESHEFVCCCPVAGSARSGSSSSGGGGSNMSAPSVDPHILLVGSVHGSFCPQCFQFGLPSLCNHKAHSATAALSTLDVRCPRGGLTQRFGLRHRSLYPRLATSREHYVFTSHAGTALEVHDRRAMSAPLFFLPHLPRPWPAPAGPVPGAAAAVTGAAARAGAGARSGAGAAAGPSGSAPRPLGWPSLAAGRGGGRAGAASRAAAGRAETEGAEEERDADDEEEDAFGDGGDDAEDGGQGAWSIDGEQDDAAEARLRRGQGRWQAADMTAAPGDGAVEGWRDVPAAVPYEHQGLWLEASEDTLIGRADNGTLYAWDLSTMLGWARGPDRSGLWHYIWEHGQILLEYDEVDQHGAESGPAWEGAGGPHQRQQHPRGRSHVLGGQGPTCLGSVGCYGTMPVCALAPGNPTAMFNVGVAEDGREYLVASMVL